MNRTLERNLIDVLAIGFLTTLAHDLWEHNLSATDANAKELHKQLEGYSRLQGIDEATLIIDNGVLEPYKAIVQRDFRIVDMHGVMGGGMLCLPSSCVT